MKKLLPLMLLQCIMLWMTSNAQDNLLSLITGDYGCSVISIDLKESEQVTFNPLSPERTLGLNTNCTLVSTTSETDSMGLTHYRYYQTYKNIPVEYSLYIMHSIGTLLIGMNGNIVLDCTVPAEVNVSNIISATSAVSYAINHVNATKYMWEDPIMENQLKEITGNTNATYYPHPGLVWYCPEKHMNASALTLAYKVDIYAEDPLSRNYYFVDAHNGDIVGTENELMEIDATGTANTYYSGTQTIHSDYYNGSYRLRDLTKGNGVVEAYESSPALFRSNWKFIFFRFLTNRKFRQ